MKNWWLDFLKDYKNILKRLPWALVIAACSLLYAGVNTMTAFKTNVRTIPTWVDNAIPFTKYFILPYIVWYGYVAYLFVYYIIYDKNRYYKLLITISAGMLTCIAIYCFYPTYVPRPHVNGNDIFSFIVRLIYSKDHPYNCCPSIHVYESVVIAAFINHDKSFTLKGKIISTVISASIIISTLFVKQHFFIDVVSGMALAYIYYFLINANYGKQQVDLEFSAESQDKN